MSEEPLHRQIKRGSDAEPIAEVAELVERFLAAGFAVTDDRPSVTPYGTTGLVAYRPERRPPPTIVVEFIRPGLERPWRLWGVMVYPAGSAVSPVPITDPTKAAEAIERFLEDYSS